jgi:hypothetical protein
MFLKPLHLRAIDVLLAFPASRREMIDRNLSPIDWYLRHDTASIHAGGYPQNGTPNSNGIRPPKFNFYFERLVFAPRDNFGFIQGWLNDAASPLARIVIRIGSVEIAIPASQLIRTLRPELNKRFGAQDKSAFSQQLRLGFMGLFRSLDNWTPAKQARIEAVCADGTSETADVSIAMLEQLDSIARVEDLLEREEARIGLHDLVEPLSNRIAALGAVAARIKPMLNGRETEFVSYSDGSRIAPRPRPRRTTWALLLDDNPLSQTSWIASFDKPQLKLDQILIVAPKTLQDALESIVLPISFARGMDVDVLYVEAETAPVVMLEQVRAVASGDFIVFVDQMCHLSQVPKDFLAPKQNMRCRIFTGLTTEPNGTIYEGGDDFEILLEGGQPELVQSALSRAEVKWAEKTPLFVEAPGSLCCGFRADLAHDLGGFDPQFETRRFAFADLAARFRLLTGGVNVLRDLRFDQVVSTTLLKDVVRRQMRRDLVRLARKHGSVLADKPKSSRSIGLFQ